MSTVPLTNNGTEVESQKVTETPKFSISLQSRVTSLP